MGEKDLKDKGRAHREEIQCLGCSMWVCFLNEEFVNN